MHNVQVFSKKGYDLLELGGITPDESTPDKSYYTEVVSPSFEQAIQALKRSADLEGWVIFADSITELQNIDGSKNINLLLPDGDLNSSFEDAKSEADDFYSKKITIGPLNVTLWTTCIYALPENKIGVAFNGEDCQFGQYNSDGEWVSLSQFFVDKLLAAEKLTGKTISPSQATTKETSMSIKNKAKERLTKGTYRVLARKSIKKAQELLLSTLRKKGIDSIVIVFVESFLSTDVGRNAFGLVLGLAAEYAADKIPFPMLKDERISSLIETIQDESTTDLLDIAATELMSFAGPLLMEIVKELPTEKVVAQIDESAQTLSSLVNKSRRRSRAKATV